MFRKKAEAQAAALEAEQRRAEIGTVREVLARYRPGTRLSFGAPTRCPRCGDYGFADRVDRSMGLSHNHCLSCDADWILTKRALVAVQSDPSLLDGLYPEEGTPRSASSDDSEPMTDPSSPEPEAEKIATPAQSRMLEAEETGWAGAGVEVEPDVDVWTPSDRLTTPRPYAGGPIPTRTSQPQPEPTQAPATEGRSVTSAESETFSAGPTPRRLAPDLRVLVVEDNPFDLALLEEVVDAIEGVEIELVHAATRADAQRMAARCPVNIVLLDLNLPDSSGIDTLLDWHQAGVSTAPVIVMSGSSDADLIQQARDSGAVHFVQKNHLVALADQGPQGAARLLRILQSTAKTAGTP